MIKIKYSTNKIEIDGHANYGETGKDIVCAAVSTLAQGLVFELEHYYKQGIITEYKAEGAAGHMVIECNSNEEHIRTIFSFVIHTLLKIEREYPQNVLIEVVPYKTNI